MKTSDARTIDIDRPVGLSYFVSRHLIGAKRAVRIENRIYLSPAMAYLLVSHEEGEREELKRYILVDLAVPGTARAVELWCDKESWELRLEETS